MGNLEIMGKYVEIRTCKSFRGFEEMGIESIDIPNSPELTPLCANLSVRNLSLISV
jgi:hypothetical protein